MRDGQYVPAPVQHVEPEDGEAAVDILDGFLDARRRAIEVYEGLAEAQWAQIFNHPTIWGDVSVEWWAERFIQHSTEHVEGLWMLRQYVPLDEQVRDRYQRFRDN